MAVIKKWEKETSSYYGELVISENDSVLVGQREYPRGGGSRTGTWAEVLADDSPLCKLILQIFDAHVLAEARAVIQAQQGD